MIEYQMETELEPELLEDSDNWISDLKAALIAQPDFSTIRKVSGGRPLPKDCRAQAWLVLLGVAHKPDPFLDFDNLYDLPEQTLIRLHCQQVVEKLGNESGTDKLAVTSDLESILTLYCKQRRDAEWQNESVGNESATSDGASASVFDQVQSERKKSGVFEPENGWMDVLQLLAALNLSKHHLYNVFYAITTKYIPRGCVPNGRPFDLFRLLLLYHDPQLCSFLDTRKLSPDYYASSWFNSLFASTCSLDVALAMWDVYLQQADPFLVFFMALVILINARDQILAMVNDPKETIAETILQFPSQLEAPDIADFCQLAAYYSKRTPQSFRRDYHGPLYGSHFMADGFENITVHTLLCLPVSIQELLKSSTSPSPTKKKWDMVAVGNDEEDDDQLRFFVVDGRPPKQYNNGHIPGAFSIDASLLVNDPAQFHSLAKTLEQIKARTQPESHWCLMGSGRDEEDKYIHMVASYLLQRNTLYVSIARGGYQALHETLKETLATRLKSHSVKGCLVCNEIGKSTSDAAAAVETSPKRSLTPKDTVSVGNGNRASITEKSWSIFSRVKDVVKNKSAEVKDYVLVAAAGTGGEDGGGRPVYRHIDSQDRNASGKKPYRNLVNVFSISEDASDDEFGSGAEEENGADDSDRTASTRERVRLKEWLKRTEIVGSYECQEIDEQSIVHPSHLALTRTHLFVLREIPDQAGYAFVKSRRGLSTIQRITSKRQHPEVLTFKYGFELAPDRQKITGAERFWVPKAGDCAKAVKTAIVQLQESVTSPPTGDDYRPADKVQSGEAEI